MTQRLLRVLAVLLLATFAVSVFAEDKQLQRAQEQLRKMRQQLQETKQAQQVLEAEQQKTEQVRKELDAQVQRRTREASTERKKAGELAGRLTELEAQAEVLRQERTSLQAQVADFEKRLAAEQTLVKQTNEKLQSSELKSNTFALRLNAETQERKRCEVNNLALYQHGRSLLDMYRNKGVLKSLLQDEPLTGIGAVGIENVLEEYRDKLDQQKLLGGASRAGPSPSSSGGDLRIEGQATPFQP